MRKNWVKLAGILSVVGVLVIAGCGGNDNRESLELERYHYTAIAEVDRDSVDVDDDAIYWECEGKGVLPVKIGKRDVASLRDTLMKIAAVAYDGKTAKPLLPRGYKPELVSADSVSAGSEVLNELSIVLMTPDVMVWRNFSYAYPKGAAHGNYSNTYINYSLTDGKILTFTDIFKSGSEDDLAELLRGQLSGRDDLLVDVDDIEVPEGFYLTTDGVTFVYGLYAIAPYSSGEIEVPLRAQGISEMLTEEGKACLGL